MKAVLFSIKPKHCKMIFNREKGIEVRVRIPSLKPPYKAYVYCTKEELWTEGINIMDGHVIGEFEVNAVEPMIKDGLVQGEQFVPGWKQRLSCLTEKEILDYAKNRQAYGLFIKNAFLFEQPKELTDFHKFGAPSMDQMDDGESLCRYCIKTDYGEHKSSSSPDGPIFCEGRWCDEAYEDFLDDEFLLTRPPQSWCYVEEL